MSGFAITAPFQIAGKWTVFLGVAFVAVVFTAWPEGEQTLRYERQLSLSTESWRLLSAHFVHLSPTHVFFNLLGLALICELLWGELPLRHGVGAILSATLGIDLLLWTLDPQVQWYAGLSGVVHGLWAACVTAALLPVRPTKSGDRRTLASLAGVLLTIKLLLEGAGIFSSGVPANGFAVIHAAHAYGAGSGAAYVLLWRAIVALSRRQ